MQKQNVLHKAYEMGRGSFMGFLAFGKKMGWVKVGLAALVLIIVVWALVAFLGGKAPAQEALSQMRTVELRSIADLSSGTSPLSIAGTVNSKSEASVRAERGGQITQVYSTLGGYVNAGAVVAELSNASERAAVAQAQGAVDAATAGASVSETSLTSAKQSSIAALLSAYGSVNKAVRTDIDPMFSNPDAPSPKFNVQSSDSQAKINVENTRPALSTILSREQAKASNLSASEDLSSELAVTQKELRVVRDYLDEVLRTLNSGIAINGITEETITGYIATANAARSAITASLAALISSQQAIETAQKSSSTSGQVSASGAALTQAQAGLAAARANLEKTIVRAPISGTINSLPLKVGDYLSPGALAVTIANNGALEVLAYVTDIDAREITVGGSATIENNGTTVKGAVTKIAPAIDPSTKKIEVRIGITEGTQTLVNGQAVTVSITRQVKTASAAGARITIPISALKVGADSISVFTVDSENKLVSHVVMIGTLLGDRVVLTSGVTADMKIVTDARGLQPGQQVIVK